MYILNHYFKPENKTDNSDLTKFGMKIGPVPDLQELPYCIPRSSRVLGRPGQSHGSLLSALAWQWNCKVVVWPMGGFCKWLKLALGGSAVFPKLNAGQILQKCGYYAGTFSFKMRVLCGY